MSTRPTHSQDTLPHIQQSLDELHLKVDDVNRKLDLLMAQFNTNKAPGFQDISATGNASWDAPGLDALGLSTGEEVNHMGTSPRIPGMAFDDMTAWCQGGYSHLNELKLSELDPPVAMPPSAFSIQQLPPGMSDNPHLLQANPAPLSPEFSNFSELPLGMLPASTVDLTNMRADQNPPQILNIPSLATAKPNVIENDIQSESCSPASMNSTGTKEKRTEREREKTRCLEQICLELGIVRTRDKLLDIQAVIRGLGWTVPESGVAAGGKRGKGMAWAACIKELAKQVGPWKERPIELDVLQTVLARVRSGDEEPLVGEGSMQTVCSHQ